jgi:hypothetical protein
MKQSLYIKCEDCLLSKKVNLILTVLATITTVAAYFLNLTLQISTLTAYSWYALSSLIVTFSLYQIIKERKMDYIYLNEQEVWFKEKQQNETVCLKYDKLNFFETKFSEIVFITKEEKKMIMPLNTISNKKQRWEIKEFLKAHIKQTREHQAPLLASE